MKYLNAFLLVVLVTLYPVIVAANSGDYSGGVAIGTSYAGVDTAPTNGLIIQGAVGIGTTAPSLATLQTSGLIGNTAAIFAGDTTGVSLVAAYPSIGFNTYYGSAWSSLQTGYGGYIQVEQAAGAMVFLTANTVTGQGTTQSMVERMRLTQNGNVGIGTGSPGATLEVNGQVKVDTWGSAAATAICKSSTGSTAGILSTCSSSIRYKENVKPASYGLKEIMAMRPVTFKWKGRAENDLGLIAEDVEKVNPMFVTYEQGQIEGVKYQQLTAVLVKGMQEQQAEIDSLKETIDQLRQRDNQR